MHIKTLQFKLSDTLVAAFWSVWGTIFQPLDTLWGTPWALLPTLAARSSKNHRKNFFLYLIFKSIFHLETIYHILGVFLKAHLGGLARLLAPKSKPNCFKMEFKMEPDVEAMQNCRTLIWACI